MKKRFTEEQIIKILEEGRSGLAVGALCRKYAISPATYATYYNWKNKFNGLTTSEAKRLKALATENAQLKRLVAEQALDIIALKDVVTKKVIKKC